MNEIPGIRRPPYRVAVAEPHPVLCRGLCEMIARDRTVRIVARIASVDDLHRRLDPGECDLLLLDSDLLGDSARLTGTGAGAGTPLRLPEILAVDPARRVLVYTFSAGRAFLHHALESGVHGVLLKDEGLDQIPQAIAAIRRGGHWFSDRLLTQRQRPPSNRPPY